MISGSNTQDARSALARRISIGEKLAEGKYRRECEGLPDRQTKSFLALLLENERNYLLTEETRGIN